MAETILLYFLGVCLAVFVGTFVVGLAVMTYKMIRYY